MLSRLFRRPAAPPPPGSPPAELIEAIHHVAHEQAPLAPETLSRLKDGAHPLDVEEAKRLARHADPDVRKALAQRGDTKPELLYFLAADAVPEVRREIAANRETPRQADLVLARDVDEEVRCELARKIARLIPHLTEAARERIGDQAIEILELLAKDQLPRVRAILSEELKHSSSVPHRIVRALALDVERMVAAPIAEYSPLLSDEDLLEIIRNGVAVDAVARRATVSERVTDAVVATAQAPAVASLLDNPKAQIREETLDAIIDQAREVEQLHRPLVLRQDLSLRAIRRIAGFVAASLLSTLVERHRLDAETAGELTRAVRDRINELPSAEPETEDDAEAKAKAAFDAGEIDDAWLENAADNGDQRLVRHALALTTGLAMEIITRILGARSPKAVTALAWKGGFNMRNAVRLQTRIARIPAAALLYARNGTDFPLTPAEMQWQLDYFNK